MLAIVVAIRKSLPQGLMIKYDVEMYQSGECTRLTQCWSDSVRAAKNYATRWAVRVCKLPLNQRYRWTPLQNAAREVIGYSRDFVNCEIVLKKAGRRL